ncbi:alpha/beta hydrolase [Streptomyces turgidiscabies]|uniref:alpha/beta hydrolase n=1 Tax=Streptomyces TaxID=1883 RepID=UPI0002D998FA|nr:MULTISPECIES: alpha/beta fold hydrolase [Streptomyces]MDX3492862.1 alpha/beta fold hydrolase [Streptomyces turgidiscabies]GAQ74232.1 alpha/beta hydrolase family protein [Streptomyces turgidiscabies]
MSTGPAGHVTRSFAVPNSETADRTPLRRFLTTDDGVTIDAVYEPGGVVYDASAPPSGHLSDHVVFVVAHGFTGDVDRPHVRRVAEVFARYGAVLTFSFRGHGASGGRSTVGDREVLDLAAAVRWARELGHTRVATVGFSMGGSVVLRHAALYEPKRGGRTEAASDVVVSVSAPARWYYRGTAPMRRVHWLITRPEGRLVGRYGLRTRIHHRDWNPVPLSPVEAAARIAPRPLLIVHGDRDGYFPVDHPRMLAAAAGDAGELWLEPGMGHAEHAAGEELLRRIGDWAVAKAG